MAKVRYVRFQIPAVAAGARTNPTGAPSFDDNQQRRLTGFRSTNTTALIHTQIDVAGRVFADIDHGSLPAQADWVELEQVYPMGVPFSVNVINDSAGALAVNTAALVLRYEVTDTGPVGAVVAMPG